MRKWVPNPTGKGRKDTIGDPIARRFIEILFDEWVKSGQSLTDFASDVGLTDPSFLSMWFNGKRGSAMIETVVKIWKKLGRSLDEDFLK